LQILLCPIYFNGYNESLLALNSEHTKQQCKGTPDWTADPPVVKFNFSITEDAITAYFSHVQYINISGMVCSKDPSTGAITYHQEVMYRFSCRYPLQYLVNNTQMSVLAVKDNNGSFISTLSMRLYSDNDYSFMLRIPPGGLELKTRIFVEVKASNLTNRLYSNLVENSDHYLSSSRCDRDGQTVMGVNGQQQEARFSFEAFRFVQSTDETFSTYYVHCATRLCMNSFCHNLIQGTIVSDMATISSGPITTRSDNGENLNGLLAFKDTTIMKAQLHVSFVFSQAICWHLEVCIHCQHEFTSCNPVILSTETDATTMPFWFS
uniref:Si:ch73-261i21.5 n=1 Tax=Seriola dumerili TaxID=41447 RepID=A0A3B4VG94_SERDU